MSPPMWGCGLKLPFLPPFVKKDVTPYVGVWIETALTEITMPAAPSPPMWGCGLKPRASWTSPRLGGVTPYVGVWIETNCEGPGASPLPGHPLCGGVD